MKDITIKPNITILQAMRILSKTGVKCLLVVDRENTLLGTLTDGDLRRSILAGSEFSNDISTSYNTEPTMLIKNKFDLEKAKKLLREKKVELIPVVDENNAVVDYITWTSVNNQIKPKNSLSKVPVVIMAGGKGTRLEPFTKVLPKPLIPIHERPIIEHIINRFTDIGCLDFHLTVNYKEKILIAYFEELQPKYNIQFLKETNPLGTGGSLYHFAGKFDKPFFVTNCDIIINTDYNSIYEFHHEGKYDITLVASAKEYIIPYGTCELNIDGNLSQINEKPQYDFLINTGFYIINPNLLDMIPKNKFYHITHLIKEVKDSGKKVGVYPVEDDAWTDVGQWAEYKKAVEKFL